MQFLCTYIHTSMHTYIQTYDENILQITTVSMQRERQREREKDKEDTREIQIGESFSKSFLQGMAVLKAKAQLSLGGGGREKFFSQKTLFCFLAAGITT